MSQSEHDVGTRCDTCRGWSCMQCAWAVEHTTCRMDCPDCDDYRVRPEEPWLAPGDSPQAGDDGRGGLSTLIRRAQRNRRQRGRKHDPAAARRGLGLQVVLA